MLPSKTQTRPQHGRLLNKTFFCFNFDIAGNSLFPKNIREQHSKIWPKNRQSTTKQDNKTYARYYGQILVQNAFSFLFIINCLLHPIFLNFIGISEIFLKYMAIYAGSGRHKSTTAKYDLNKPTILNVALINLCHT